MVDGFINDKAELHIPENMKLNVKWPDGHLSTEKIIHKQYHNSVYDHGYTYNVNGTLPYLKIDYHGVSILVDVDQVQVKKCFTYKKDINKPKTKEEVLKMEVELGKLGCKLTKVV